MKPNNKKNGVKNIRLKLGMSQGKFASAIGRTPAAVSNYEVGERAPDKDTAYAIIDLAKSNGLTTSLEDIYLRS
jgi:DNA-binding XRE family transcriptional regulator